MTNDNPTANATTDNPAPTFWTAEEILKMTFPPTSEDRFDALPGRDEAVSLITGKVLEFQAEHSLETRCISGIDTPLELPAKGRFTYNAIQSALERIEGQEPVTLIIVTQNNQIIGYAMASRETGETDIEIIDVDSRFTRSGNPGLSMTIRVADEEFTVGVGHILVLAALTHCPPPFRVDATHESSRYIFKSLGFRHDETTTNPCILVREQGNYL